MTKPISELYEWLMSLDPVERADWMQTNDYEPATFGKTEREMGVSPGNSAETHEHAGKTRGGSARTHDGHAGNLSVMLPTASWISCDDRPSIPRAQRTAAAPPRQSRRGADPDDRRQPHRRGEATTAGAMPWQRAIKSGRIRNRGGYTGGPARTSGTRLHRSSRKLPARHRSPTRFHFETRKRIRPAAKLEAEMAARMGRGVRLPRQ